jgi:hypothetical protein
MKYPTFSDQQASMNPVREGKILVIFAVARAEGFKNEPAQAQRPLNSLNYGVP